MQTENRIAIENPIVLYKFSRYERSYVVCRCAPTPAGTGYTWNPRNWNASRVFRYEYELQPLAVAFGWDPDNLAHGTCYEFLDQCVKNYKIVSDPGYLHPRK